MRDVLNLTGATRDELQREIARLEDVQADLRGAVQLALGRLVPIPAEEPGESSVCWRGYFSRGEVECLRRLAGEVEP